MANRYYDELIQRAGKNQLTHMKYDDGRSAGLYTRGNVLLGVSRFLTSLKPRLIDMFVMRFLF